MASELVCVCGADVPVLRKSADILYEVLWNKRASLGLISFKSRTSHLYRGLQLCDWCLIHFSATLLHPNFHLIPLIISCSRAFLGSSNSCTSEIKLYIFQLEICTRKHVTSATPDHSASQALTFSLPLGQSWMSTAVFVKACKQFHQF